MLLCYHIIIIMLLRRHVYNIMNQILIKWCVKLRLFMAGRGCGVDMGMVHFATLDAGTKVQGTPKFQGARAAVGEISGKNEP